MILKIRPALPRDADILSHIAFSAKAYWGYPAKWMEIWKPQLTFSPEYFELYESWVTEVDNAPAAFYTLQERNGTAWIENLWVLPEFIGRGFGEELFLHALSRSRVMGHLVLRLESDPNAVGFYEKMGMYKVNESNYPVEGQIRILSVMEIKL
ncbi:MAG TPA: GNAT family N-acetyltransferase [Anaerolineales bacterium]